MSELAFDLRTNVPPEEPGDYSWSDVERDYQAWDPGLRPHVRKLLDQHLPENTDEEGVDGSEQEYYEEPEYNEDGGAPPRPEVVSGTGNLETDLYTTLESLDAYRPVFEDIATQLREGIQTHRWDAVIGEDGSGRLPALFVGRLLSRYAKEHDLPAPKRLFVASGAAPSPRLDREDGEYETRWEQEDRMAEEAAAHAAPLEAAVSARISHPVFDSLERKRVLVATEHIDSGGAIGRTLEALQERFIDYDVVTFSHSYAGTQDMETLNSGGYSYNPSRHFTIYVGESGIGNNPLFHRTNITPVREYYQETDPDRLTTSDMLHEAKGIKRGDVDQGVALRDTQARVGVTRIVRKKLQKIADDCYVKCVDINQPEDLDATNPFDDY